MIHKNLENIWGLRSNDLRRPSFLDLEFATPQSTTYILSVLFCQHKNAQRRHQLRASNYTQNKRAISGIEYKISNFVQQDGILWL